eukprot:PhM_4_TR14427/c0_g2_i1/m.24273
MSASLFRASLSSIERTAAQRPWNVGKKPPKARVMGVVGINEHPDSDSTYATPQELLRQAMTTVRGIRREVELLRRFILSEVSGASAMLEGLLARPPTHTVADGVQIAALRTELYKKNSVVDEARKSLDDMKRRVEFREREYELRVDSINAAHEQRERTMQMQINTLQGMLEASRRRGAPHPHHPQMSMRTPQSNHSSGSPNSDDAECLSTHLLRMHPSLDREDTRLPTSATTNYYMQQQYRANPSQQHPPSQQDYYVPPSQRITPHHRNVQTNAPSGAGVVLPTAATTYSPITWSAPPPPPTSPDCWGHEPYTTRRSAVGTSPRRNHIRNVQFFSHMSGDVPQASPLINSGGFDGPALSNVRGGQDNIYAAAHAPYAL